MKLDEFERKLMLVPDTKLVKMLRAARVDGPDVAAKLIEGELDRRGLEVPGKPAEPAPLLDTSASDPFSIDAMPPADVPEGAPLPDADERVRSAFAGMDRPLSNEGQTGDEAHVDFSPAEAGAAAPSPGAWLHEEASKSRIPAAFKVILYLGMLGGLVALLFKFLQRN
jgi:hypothetical protein